MFLVDFSLQSSKSFISNAVYFQDTFEACAALEDSEYVKTNFASVHVRSLLTLLDDSEKISLLFTQSPSLGHLKIPNEVHLVMASRSRRSYLSGC